MHKKVVLVLLAFCYLSCSQRPTQEVPPEKNEKVLFEKGVAASNARNYSDSISYFEQLLQQNPTTRWVPDSYFYIGLGHEGLKNWTEAVRAYQKVQEYFSTVDSPLKAKALHRLTFCYEMLGQEDRVILSLLELERRGGLLGQNFLQLELPARLAGAYARAGNQTKALKYFKQAEKAIKRSRRTGAVDPEWYSKTLFNMGTVKFSVPASSKEKFIGFVDSLKNSQQWLLQCMQGPETVWSSMSREHLADVYQTSFQYVQAFPVPNETDQVLALQHQLEAQKEMAKAMDSAIAEVRRIKIPSRPNATDHVAILIESLQGVQKGIDEILAKKELRDQLTPEAEYRKNLERRKTK
ncbi:MAG: tetratricopeptide repeat protein [Oligoflexia bacterium]|nr:tetratricopeptide repeat protein [Oligoflexia bacterium]